MPTALMIQGTASGVGKSWLATALCRLLARRGLRVLPFKAQNMSNNAAPARLPDGGWGEVGRAQAAQAEAAGVEPMVDMNPVLIKPMALGGASVVVLGKPELALDSRPHHERWAEIARAAYDRVAAQADVVVLEGAGSPAEINLRETDIANMAMARHADAAVLLVGDIDRGGVFASLYGTISLLLPEDRARVAGLVINRFRGDVRRLVGGLGPLAGLCGVPVRGVLPCRRDIRIDAEDGEDLADSGGGELDVVALRLPTVANFTDLGRLAEHPGVGLRYVDSPSRVGNPDLLILPGSRDTVSDRGWMRDRGLDRAVIAAAARGIPVLGLCGGYQMLGRRMGGQPGLGLLPVETEYLPEKIVRPARGRTRAGWLLPAGLDVEGYEIHEGRTGVSGPTWLDLDAGEDGCVLGNVAGSYLHGLLDTPGVVSALVAALRSRKGLDAQPADGRSAAERRVAMYDAAADLVEEHLDLSGLLP